MEYESWGRYPKASHRTVSIQSRFDQLPRISPNEHLLAYGAGRSYGDSCLNDGHFLLPMQRHNRYISFDRQNGILCVEAGITLEEILRFIVPQGWFLPVTPGTKFVTIGGAIANDIHGKNHHCDGNFGHHVTRLELLRSNGERLVCSPSENIGLFDATVGGLGLTGLITWAEFRLRRIFNPFITQEVIRFKNLNEFFVLSKESEADFVYTVAWVDCLAQGKHLGRGLYMRGNHTSALHYQQLGWKVSNRTSVPFDLPGWTLNPITVKAFNAVYYRKQLNTMTRSIIPYEPFFYPLDSVHQWNRIYGKRGFLQWQCVVPFQDGPDAITEILKRIARSGMASFLAVLKTFGSIPSRGILSFPRPGVTLALDFPMVGDRLLKLLHDLDTIVRQAGGAIYPAKDARMSPESFQQFFPRWKEFLEHKDPKFSSSLWRRLTDQEWSIHG